MFEQHPVPQQISSYQFRLVGDMTLKQFFQLAAGAVVGLIIYSLPLPGFFKWPLIVLVVIGGAAFAFLPVQDRPLEQWLAAFFRSIYAPTIFVWKKAEKPMEYFATEVAIPQPAIPDDAISQTIAQDVPTQTMEQNEQDFLSRVASMFKVKQSVAPAAAATTPAAYVDSAAVQEAQTQPTQASSAVVPQTRVQVKPQGFTVPAPYVPVTTSAVGQVFNPSTITASNTAQFSPEAAPPIPPTTPNIIVGQVMDANGKIVEGAIIEITDSEGRPVRALKTNKAGHFMIVTPLSNGQYRLTTEKQALTFKPVNITLTGAIVPPLAIKSDDALAPTDAPEGRAVWSAS